MPSSSILFPCPPMRRQSLLNLATAIATISAVVAVGLVLRREFSPVGEVGVSSREDWRSFADSGLRIGTANTPVTITVFVDPFCGHCAKAWHSISTLRDSLPLQVSVVLRHFPFTMHSRPAAHALTCSFRQDRLEQMLSAIEHRDSTGVTALIETGSWSTIADQIGVPDTLAFNACVADPATDSLVARDLSSGRRLKVASVPTILVNEALLAGNPGDALLRKLVRERLAMAERR